MVGRRLALSVGGWTGQVADFILVAIGRVAPKFWANSAISSGEKPLLSGELAGSGVGLDAGRARAVFPCRESGLLIAVRQASRLSSCDFALHSLAALRPPRWRCRSRMRERSGSHFRRPSRRRPKSLRCPCTAGDARSGDIGLGSVCRSRASKLFPRAREPVYTTPPGYTAAPYTQPQPYAAPGPYAAPPSAPYYAPGPTAPPGTLYPEGPPALAPVQGPWEPVATWPRFLQAIRASETYMYDNPSPRGLAFNDIETSATFAVPFLSERAPLLLTPGFGLNLWDGPVPDSPTGADLPAQTYSAYLDTGWNPQPSPWFGAELGVRVGVYSDFDTFNTHSIRIMGRGLGVINYSPEMQIKLGVIYLDRNKIKLLPAAGVFITPDADTHWEIFFPRPKYTHRVTTTGAYQVWWYIQARNMGAGAWTHHAGQRHGRRFRLQRHPHVDRPGGGAGNVEHAAARLCRDRLCLPGAS